MGIKIKLDLVNYIDDDSRKILVDIVDNLEFIINSGYFKRAVLRAHFPKESMSSAECYEKLLENGLSTKLRVKILADHNRPMTVSEDDTINFYTESVKGKSPEKLAGILAHEFSHIKGFEHDASGQGTFGLWLQEEIPKLVKDYNKKVKSDIFWFWVELCLIHIARFSLSFFGFPLLPFALILKYAFGVKDIWLLNDTEDGDFGGKNNDWWRHKDKPKWIRFILWWLRNHSWNFLMKFNPDWNNGEVQEFITIKDTTGLDKRWVWCSRKGYHGENYVAYRVYENGKIFCRKSKANFKRELQIGCGGNRYKLKKKPLFF